MKADQAICIFVVDDEQVIAETLATIFQRQGFSAHSFVNPLDAIDAARDKMPNFLVSDVMMPQLTGFELANQIKILCPHCHVFLISGQAGTMEVTREAQKAGSTLKVLQKPVHPEILLRNIYQHLPDRSGSQPSHTTPSLRHDLLPK